MAKEYARIFGERPSPARKGIFARTLNESLTAAGITATIDEKRLSGIFARSHLAGNLSKRGRKSGRIHS